MVSHRPRHSLPRVREAKWWHHSPLVASAVWLVAVAAATCGWAIEAFDASGVPAHSALPVLWSSPAAVVVLAVWWRGARGAVLSAVGVTAGALGRSWIGDGGPFGRGQWIALALAGVAAPLVAAAVLRRAHADLRRPGVFDAIRFVAVVAVGACTSAFAVIGLLALWHRTPEDLVGALRSLAVNDLSAIVVVVPVAFVLRGARTRRLARPPRLGRSQAAPGRVAWCVAGAVAIAAMVTAMSLGGTSIDVIVGVALMLALVVLAEERRRNESAARRTIGDLAFDRARFQSFVDSSPDGVLVLDALGRVESVNRGACRIFDAAPAGLVGRSLLDLLPAPEGVDSTSHLVEVLGSAPGASPQHRVWEAASVKGSRLLVDLTVSRIDVGGRWGYIARVRDGRAADGRAFDGAAVAHPADRTASDWTDQVVAGPRLEAALRRLEADVDAEAEDRPAGELAVFLVAIDRAPLEAAIGADDTEALLAEAAKRLRAAARESDAVVHVGDAQLALVCRVDAGAVGAIAVRLLADLERPYSPYRSPLPVAVPVPIHIGVAVASQIGIAADELLRSARAALRRAARERSNGWCVFTPALDAEGAAIDLREPVGDDRIVVRYQPMLDLASGEVAAVEALARLRRDDGSLVAPTEFVSLWERTGLAGHLGEIVLPRALQDLVTLRAEPGYESLRMSVNVSPHQLGNELVDLVRTSLARFELTPDALLIEMTETAPIDTMEDALAVLRTLHALGVGIALDDFGTGFTRLDLIRDLPIDTLKIDASFVRRMVDSSVDYDIIDTIVGLARRRHLTVVAEGVETVEQVEALTRLGCSQAQGFLFGRPADVEQLRYLLREWQIVPAIATSRER